MKEQNPPSIRMTAEIHRLKSEIHQLKEQNHADRVSYGFGQQVLKDENQQLNEANRGAQNVLGQFAKRQEERDVILRECLPVIRSIAHLKYPFEIDTFREMFGERFDHRNYGAIEQRIRDVLDDE